jgi:cytochrome c peroxidase
MKIKILKYFSLVILIYMVSGCKKDPGVNTPEVYHPTPYVFSSFPDYVPPVNQFIPATNPITVEGVSLGRMLFYDSTLSKDNTLACAGCHLQRYGFTDRGRQFSFGVGDSIGNRNSMALFNIPWERGGFFWDARAPILDSQIVGPVPNVKEMHEPWSGALAKIQARPEYPDMFFKAFGTKTVTKENTVMAIAQFLRTIMSFHSKYDSVKMGLAGFSPSEMRGEQLFSSDPVRNQDPNNHTVALGHRLPGTGFDCFHCHAAPLFTPENLIPTSQVLMNDGVGTINIKVPSLRNLKFTAPYMHDGSMPNLDSVIAHYDHEIDPNSPFVSNLMYAKKYTDPSEPSSQLATPHMEMTAQDIADLKAFLNTLNDYTLLTNKNYSNPFLH